MKKTLFLWIVAVAAILNVNAQTQYNFSVASAPYTALSGGISFHSVLPDTIIKTGFPVYINNLVNDTLFLRLPFARINTQQPNMPAVSFQAFGAEQIGGTHEYLISGTIGSRILKLQFSNIRFSHDFTGQDFINYQVWYYESDKAIEVRFGSSSVTNPQSYFIAGEGTKNGAAIGFQNLWITGTPSGPATTTLSGSTLDGTPPPGTVYRFAMATTGISDKEAITQYQTLIYPNPASDILYFTQECFNYDYIVSDITGKIWLKGTVKEAPLLIGNLAGGSYFIKLTHEAKATATQYFIKM